MKNNLLILIFIFSLIGIFSLMIYNQLSFISKILYGIKLQKLFLFCTAIIIGYFNLFIGILLFVSMGSKTFNGIPVTQSMLNMGGMFSKSKTQLLPLAGVALGAHLRQYAYQPAGYGNVKYDSDNYTSGANKVFLNLKDFVDHKNQKGIYDTMYAVINNTNGIFTKNYGKTLKVLNQFISEYNKANPNNPITEQGYFYSTNELSFCNKNTQGIVTNNLHEILATKAMMEKNQNILVERAFPAEGKFNLSGQKQPEYTIGIFNSTEKDLVVYDSDLKTTDENSFQQKLGDLATKPNNIGKDILGANIFIVATEGKESKDVILSPRDTKILVSWMKQKSQEYPEAFKNFNPHSLDFECFQKTGNTKYLNKLDAPGPRFLNPQELQKVHVTNGNFEKSDVFNMCDDD